MIGDGLEKKVLDEATSLLPEVYGDLASPVLKEIGSVSGRGVRALLSPIRGMLWGWERIEKFVESEITRRIEKVPENCRKAPEPEIAVPLLNALAYTAQNINLREMFLNLLTNSMDERKTTVVHPSFVDLIKNMNSLDAIVIERLSNEKGYIKVINPRIGINGTDKIFIDATPEWYIGWTVNGYSIFDMSSCIIRLGKFGLLELMYDRTAGQGVSEIMKQSPDLQIIASKLREINPGIETQVLATDSIIYVNEYGKQFINACKS
jgi:hypothetical protein